jgi:hypothetical protein
LRQVSRRVYHTRTLKESGGTPNNVVVPEGLRTFVATVAVIGGVGVAGYFAVTELGWDRTLEFLGFDIVAVMRAPDSQCGRAREQQTEDEAVTCISDRRWLRAYAQACVDAEEPGLVFVDTDGALTGTGKCPPGPETPSARSPGRPHP